MRKSLELYTETGDKRGQAINIANIGNVYNKQGLFQNAMEYYEKALPLYEELKIKAAQAVLFGNIGDIYAKAEYIDFSPEKASFYLSEALKINEECGAESQTPTVYRALIQLYSNVQDWKSAFLYSEQYHSLYIRLNNEQSKKYADRINLERQLAQREKELALSIKDREIESLKSAELLREIEKNRQELQLLIQYLVKKDDFIRSVAAQLEQAMQLTNGESRRAVFSVIELISDRSADEEERATILLQLQTLYGPFMHTLQKKFPALNKAQIQTCALLLMELSTRDIAIILNVGERTVEKYRSDIRKKTGLPPSGDIIEMLKLYL